MRAYIKPHEAIKMIKDLGEDAMLLGFSVSAKKAFSIEQKTFGSNRNPRRGEDLTHISNVGPKDRDNAMRGKSF